MVSLPENIVAALRALHVRLAVRRGLAILTSLGLFIAWYYQKQLYGLLGIVLILFFLDSLRLGAGGRRVIQSVQELLGRDRST
jgi:hypothetical protein